MYLLPLHPGRPAAKITCFFRINHGYPKQGGGGALFGAARSEGERLLPEIQSRAKELNLAQLPALIRRV